MRFQRLRSQELFKRDSRLQSRDPQGIETPRLLFADLTNCKSEGEHGSGGKPLLHLPNACRVGGGGGFSPPPPMCVSALRPSIEGR